MKKIEIWGSFGEGRYTPESLRQRLIEEVGAGGGYLLSAGATPEHPKLENLRAIMEAVRECGVYRK